MLDMSKVILSLCDRSGEWSRPYREAGYEVIQRDLHFGHDIRLEMFQKRRVHGILAAPPCTHFSRAGAHKWKEKGSPALLEGLSIVDACLRAVVNYRPQWWCLENPIGRLKDYLGEPTFKFDPCDFGDPWTKRTWLWGYFTPPQLLSSPETKPVRPTEGDRTTKLSSRSPLRSVTPGGFARAFFAANP